MMYHQTKFGFQGINSSDNIIQRVIFDLMSPCCDLDLEDSNNNNNKYPHDSGSWCCISVPNLVTECSVIQKISPGQTFTDISNLRCDLNLELDFSTGHSKLMMLYHRTKFGCKPTSSLEDATNGRGESSGFTGDTSVQTDEQGSVRRPSTTQLNSMSQGRMWNSVQHR